MTDMCTTNVGKALPHRHQNCTHVADGPRQLLVGCSKVAFRLLSHPRQQEAHKTQETEWECQNAPSQLAADLEDGGPPIE